jgi:hypothetical protein
MSEIVWDGMGLIDHNIAVHYNSDHSDCEAMKEAQ